MNQNQSAGPEQREIPRFEQAISGRWTTVDPGLEPATQRLLPECEVLDISPEGCKVLLRPKDSGLEPEDLQAAGMDLYVRVFLNNKLTELRGPIKWARPQHGERHLIGLQFVGLGEHDLGSLNRYLTRPYSVDYNHLRRSNLQSAFRKKILKGSAVLLTLVVIILGGAWATNAFMGYSSDAEGQADAAGMDIDGVNSLIGDGGDIGSKAALDEIKDSIKEKIGR